MILLEILFPPFLKRNYQETCSHLTPARSSRAFCKLYLFLEQLLFFFFPYSIFCLGKKKFETISWVQPSVKLNLMLQSGGWQYPVDLCVWNLPVTSTHLFMASLYPLAFVPAFYTADCALLWVLVSDMHRWSIQWQLGDLRAQGPVNCSPMPIKVHLQIPLQISSPSYGVNEGWIQKNLT